MDEKCIRQNRSKLLQVLIKTDSDQLKDPIFALIQRLIINTPDRVDDRKNTIDCLMTLLLSRSEEEKKRINTWLKCCGRCGIANIRMCTVCLCTSLLMSQYVSDSVAYQAQHSQHSQQSQQGQQSQQNQQSDNKQQSELEEMDVEEEERKAFSGLKKRVVKDEEFEDETTVVERELFLDEKPLYDVFFSLVLGRCQDIVISIRGEATHVVYVVLCKG